MEDGIKLYNDFCDNYEEAFYAWNVFYPWAAKDLQMYLGDQWETSDKIKLQEEGRSTWSFNLIRKNINMVDGYQRAHRLSSVVVPQEAQDQQAADDLSQMLQYVFQAGDGYKTISDAFSGAIKTGWNLCTVWMDYRDDPVNGDIKFGREPYSGFITDPYFTRKDLGDCNYVIRRKYLSPEQVISLLPGYEKEIWEIWKNGNARDDKFTWLPYQQQPNGQDYIAYNEFYEQKWRQVPVLVDEQTGEYTEWEGPKEALEQFLKQFPQLKKITKPKRYVECHIILNDVYIKSERNQFGLNEYPFVPFFGIFEPESDRWELKLQSLVRCMVDPQTETNRRLSQMTDMIESQINSGWLADEDSVINPNSLFQSGQGKVIWRRQNAKPGAVEKIQPGNIPPSFFQLTDVFAQGMSEILGVNDAAFGIPESGQETASLMMMRQGAAITNLQYVFDNLRSAQKQLSEKVLKLALTWTPEKWARILGRQPDPRIFQEGVLKYDIAIQEGILTDTQRQMRFRQMTDLYQLTGGPGVSPITPQMLYDEAPLQGKTQISQLIAQNMQQAQQQAQQQQQMQMEVLQGQMENLKASSIEKVAGAKERYTRAFANTSLETERSARAVDDRASAALDRVKAIKELQELDLESLMKGLTILQGLQAQTEQKEKEIRSEDLAISSQGDSLGNVLAGMPASGKQNINSNQEVPNASQT